MLSLDEGKISFKRSKLVAFHLTRETNVKIRIVVVELMKAEACS